MPAQPVAAMLEPRYNGAKKRQRAWVQVDGTRAMVVKMCLSKLIAEEMSMR